MIVNHTDVNELPDRLDDFVKQSNPPMASVRTLIREAADEIRVLHHLLEESRSVLSAYYAGTTLFNHLIEPEESRSEWMRTQLPILLKELGYEIPESAVPVWVNGHEPDQGIDIVY